MIKLNNADAKNYIIGVLGKKGSGKSALVKKGLPSLKRYLVVDVLHEYTHGVIFYNAADVIIYIDQYKDDDFHAIFRPPDGNEEAETEKILCMMNNVNNYTIIMEEVDYHCNPNYVHPELLRLVKYGRHYGRSLIWLSRNAAEVNRNLTRQSDVLITFLQTEPIDLKYLSHYAFDKTPNELGKYEYALSVGDHKCIEFLVKGEKNAGSKKGEKI